MFVGIEASRSALLALETRQDICSHNLANVDTIGFQRQAVTQGTFDALVQQQVDLTGNVLPASTRPSSPRLQLDGILDTQPGTVHTTGNNTDLAIQGSGYFAVQLAQGEGYTRNGAFSLNADHQLVTSDGAPVLGEHGPITVANANWNVSPSGDVCENGTVVDRLQVVNVPSTSAHLLGKSILTSNNATPAALKDYRIQQGALEGSNVNSITEMVDLITITRQFEANMRSLQTYDTTLDQAVTQIARVS